MLDQHYVARFHLSHFIADEEPLATQGEFYCVDKRLKRIWRSSPRRIAREEDLYVTDAPLTNDLSLERDIYKEAEDLAAPEFARLIAGADSCNVAILARFLALQVGRVPAAHLRIESSLRRRLARDHLASPKIRSAFARVPLSRRIEAAAALAKQLSTSEVPRDLTLLSSVLRPYQELRPLLEAADWYTIRVPLERGFITSDNPAIFAHLQAQRGLSPRTRPRHLVFAAAPTLCVLVCLDGAKCSAPSHHLQSEDINQATVRTAARQIICARRDIAEEALHLVSTDS